MFTTRKRQSNYSTLEFEEVNKNWLSLKLKKDWVTISEWSSLPDNFLTLMQLQSPAIYSQCILIVALAESQLHSSQYTVHFCMSAVVESPDAPEVRQNAIQLIKRAIILQSLEEKMDSAILPI